MLAGAAKKNIATVVHAKAEAIPLIDDYVDEVVCFAAFPHFSDKELAVKEFFRVLKKGGRVFIAHLMNREELQKHHGGHHAVCGDLLPCPYTMKKMFEAAGFKNTHLDEAPGWYLFTAQK
jgi:ubiquinone/menaquinone biosynthesis C-methylase UbiE